MDTHPDTSPHTSTRAKTVYFIWRILPRIILIALLCIVILLAIVIYGKQKALTAQKAHEVPQEKVAINTIVFPLHATTINDKINLPGTIEAWQDLKLMARVGGTIKEVMVQEGDEIVTGEVIARIDDRDYKIALERARAAYKLAKTDYQRDKTLYAKKVIPQQQLDTKETAMITAGADLDNAELQLSRCEITAPVDGVIRSLDAKIGLLLAVGDPVAEILKIDKVKAVIGIPESDVAAIQNLDIVDIKIKALGDKIYTGKKYFLSPAPDSMARLFRLELAIDNPKREILPGMFVRAEIIKNAVESSIVIPFYAVITRNDEQYVFVEKDGVAVKRPVSLGIMEHWMIQVTDGLVEGDRLIIEGQRSVEDGQKVKVIREINELDTSTL